METCRYLQFGRFNIIFVAEKQLNMSIDRENFIRNHTVFPRSFLKEVQIVLSYSSIEGHKTGESVNSFLNNNFKILSDSKPEEVFVPIKINTGDNALSYYFDAAECRMEVDAIEGYKSFRDSVFPKTRPLAEFAKDVAGDFGRLRLTKENYWILKTDAPEEDATRGLSFIFRTERMSLPTIKVPSDKNSWGISTSTRPEISPEIDCLIKLSVEYSDNALFYSIMLEVATVKSISYETFSKELLILNEAIYQLYIDLVSDNVLELMMKEK